MPRKRAAFDSASFFSYQQAFRQLSVMDLPDVFPRNAVDHFNVIRPACARGFKKQKNVAHLTGALFRQVRRNGRGHSIFIPVLQCPDGFYRSNWRVWNVDFFWYLDSAGHAVFKRTCRSRRAAKTGQVLHWSKGCRVRCVGNNGRTLRRSTTPSKSRCLRPFWMRRRTSGRGGPGR